uniref:PRE_C2HC domain-containing protein n=1 Tax=Caenorhabditis tropicalis TaxID=1561998 RepID=A0A1I7TAI5_9PELO
MNVNVASTFNRSVVLVPVNHNDMVLSISEKVGLIDICPNRLRFFLKGKEMEKWKPVGSYELAGWVVIYIDINMYHVCNKLCSDGIVKQKKLGKSCVII